MTPEILAAELSGRIDRAWDSHGLCVLELQVPRLLDVVRHLHDVHGCTLLLDITAVDHLARQPRFDVVYHLLSPGQRRRVRLKLPLPEHEAVVPTLTGRYGAARFIEREVHEMYGIRFDGNADLRPILLYEGFVGHPLRKDYPMEREQPIVDYRQPGAA